MSHFCLGGFFPLSVLYGLVSHVFMVFVGGTLLLLSSTEHVLYDGASSFPFGSLAQFFSKFSPNHLVQNEIP